MEGAGKAGCVGYCVYGVGVSTLYRHGRHWHDAAGSNHGGHNHPGEGVVGVLATLGKVVDLAPSTLNLNRLWEGWIPWSGRLERCLGQNRRPSHHVGGGKLLPMGPSRRTRYKLLGSEGSLLSSHELGVVLGRYKDLLVLLALSSVDGDEPTLWIASGHTLGRRGSLGARRRWGNSGPLGARPGREFHRFGVEGELLGVGIERGNLFAALAVVGRRGAGRGCAHLWGRAGFWRRLGGWFLGVSWRRLGQVLRKRAWLLGGRVGCRIDGDGGSCAWRTTTTLRCRQGELILEVLEFRGDFIPGLLSFPARPSLRPLRQSVHVDGQRSAVHVRRDLMLYFVRLTGRFRIVPRPSSILRVLLRHTDLWDGRHFSIGCLRLLLPVVFLLSMDWGPWRWLGTR